MFKINDNYLKLPGSYLFSTIAKKVAAYTEANPDAKIIRLGIGDVTQPIAPAIIEKLHGAVDEMGHAETFHGYAPDLGYAFLRDTIAKNDYQDRGCDISSDEIFVSDGAKCDCSNIQEIFSLDNKIAVCDPVYPVYVDSNVMAGRAGDYDAATERFTNVIYMPCTAENNFTPELPKETPDLIYLCFPNNPTGAVFSKEEVSEIARLAKKYDVAILADELYSRQILEKDFTYTHMRSLPEKPDKLITIMGPSKTESLSGFRLGVGYGTPEIITRMEKLQAVVSLRCAGYNQAAFYRWFSEPEGWMEKRIADHRQIRDDILKVINSCPGCWARPTEGGSYIFMQLPKLKVDIFQFTKLCRAQASVTVTPGTEFGKQYSDFIRMNFSQDHDRAVDAVKRICEMVDRYRV
mgnify:CR=1 FL=1